MKGKKKICPKKCPHPCKIREYWILITYWRPTGDLRQWEFYWLEPSPCHDGGKAPGSLRLQSLKFHVSKTELTFVFTIPQVSGTPWIPLTAPLPRPPTEPTSVPSCHSLPFAQAPHPLQFQVPLNTGIRGAVPLPVKNLHVTWPSPNLTNSLLLTGSHWAHIMYAL